MLLQREILRRTEICGKARAEAKLCFVLERNRGDDEEDEEYDASGRSTPSGDAKVLDL
jgi:hypothetical protein